jgi:Na+/proline symporter
MSSSAVAQAGIFFFVVGVSMYWRRATKEGAAATMLYGLTMFLFHPKILGRSIGLYHWGIWALLLMFGSGLTYVLVSLVTSPVAEKRLEQLFHPH